MGAETRESIVDLTSRSVSLALLQGQLLAGEISRSALLVRTYPLGAGTFEAGAVTDKVLSIAAERSQSQLRDPRADERDSRGQRQYPF